MRDKEQLVLYFFVALVVALFFYLILYGMMHTMEPSNGWKPPEISYKVTQKDESYIIRITEVKKASGKNGAFYYPLAIRKVSVKIVNESKTLILENLSLLLDNTSSNLTFYDKNGDGNFSGDDEFVIRGNLATEGKELHILFADTAALLKIISFK